MREPASRVGDVLLGKYRVVGILGRGGMGVVYDVEDTRLRRRVAVKCLLTNASKKINEAGRRFQREAQVIAGLLHPNLVTLLDYDILDDGTPAMVLERVDGLSLRHLMSRHRFSVGQVVAVLRQALDALALCHEQGLVHRDLKPENLLIANSPQRGIAIKLIDFGLTKLLADPGATALTVNGQIFGSPRFMAPEQWLRREVDGRTDLYAVGLVGFCMLRGEHFIRVGNPVEVCRAHLKQARPPLVTTADGERIPEALNDALQRAADPDISKRFPDARAMLAALNPLADAHPNVDALPAALASAATSDESGRVDPPATSHPPVSSHPPVVSHPRVTAPRSPVLVAPAPAPPAIEITEESISADFGESADVGSLGAHSTSFEFGQDDITRIEDASSYLAELQAAAAAAVGDSQLMREVDDRRSAGVLTPVPSQVHVEPDLGDDADATKISEPLPDLLRASGLRVVKKGLRPPLTEAAVQEASTVEDVSAGFVPQVDDEATSLMSTPSFSMPQPKGRLPPPRPLPLASGDGPTTRPVEIDEIEHTSKGHEDFEQALRDARIAQERAQTGPQDALDDLDALGRGRWVLRLALGGVLALIALIILALK